MNAAMATRNLAEDTVRADECTSFQLHTSQQAALDGFRHKVFDYAEHRLMLLAHYSRNQERQNFLFDLISRYRRGEVAVAWRYGEPVYIEATRD